MSKQLTSTQNFAIVVHFVLKIFSNFCVTIFHNLNALSFLPTSKYNHGGAAGETSCLKKPSIHSTYVFEKLFPHGIKTCGFFLYFLCLIFKNQNIFSQIYNTTNHNIVIIIVISFLIHYTKMSRLLTTCLNTFLYTVTYLL